MTGGGDDDDGFAGRWSRRKALARRGVPAPEPAIGDAATPAPRPDAAPDSDETAAKTDADWLAELGLPDPDTLRGGDDFKAFMAREVPRRLRNRALRRLWSSDPTLACLDGLVDYADDYTDAATRMEGMQTIYRVGRGLLPDPAPEIDAKIDAKIESGVEAGGELEDELGAETASGRVADDGPEAIEAAAARSDDAQAPNDELSGDTGADPGGAVLAPRDPVQRATAARVSAAGSSSLRPPARDDAESRLAAQTGAQSGAQGAGAATPEPDAAPDRAPDRTPENPPAPRRMRFSFDAP